MADTDATRLDQVFTHRSKTHEYTVHWTSLGSPEAPPLVFVHGTPWSSRVWRPLALALAPRFHVFLLDHAGFGQSPAARALVDVDRATELDGALTGRAEAFAALLTSWALTRPPHVVAHDNAGLVTLRAHLEHGCPYASLCLMDVVAIGPFGTPFFNVVAGHEEAFTKMPEHMMSGFVRAYIEGATFKPLADDTLQMLMAPYRAGGSQGQAAFVREMLQAHARDNASVAPLYSKLDVPVRILWGADDDWLPVDKAHKLAAALGTGAAQVVEVPEAGHLLMYDQPERVAAELVFWLGEVQARA